MKSWNQVNKECADLIEMITLQLETNSNLDRKMKEYAKHKMAAALKVCEKEAGLKPRSLRGIYHKEKKHDVVHTA